MFGYVIISTQDLSPEANARYQSAYCGLCHTIGKCHGTSARLALSYDLTFLNILLASLYEGESAETHACTHCIIHPVRKRDWHATRETDYCADMSIALHYYAAKDKWHDDKSLLGLGFMQLLNQKRKAAQTRYPRQCTAIETQLEKLSAFERDQSQDLEAVSDCFGVLMAEIFAFQDDHWQQDLRAVGYYLGKYIYLLDAYDDLAKDQKKGGYNPLRTLATHEHYEEEICEIFEDLMGRCTAAFERLPCVQDVEILRNILYAGVWLRYAHRAAQNEKTQKKNATD